MSKQEPTYKAFDDFMAAHRAGKAAVFEPTTGEPKLYTEAAVTSYANQRVIEELEAITKLEHGDLMLDRMIGHINHRLSDLQAKGEGE